MNELDNNLTEGRDPREIVLRYDAPRPEPVAERYVHPDPLPGRRAAQEAEPPKRSRRGLWILLLCAALLLVSTLGRALFTSAVRALLNTSVEAASDEFRYSPEDPTPENAETKLPRYPNGNGARLLLSETRGDALTIQQVYERVNPCTVTVAVMMSETHASVGTGVILSEDGYILTNAHVVQGGSEAMVVLDNGAVFRNAMLVGFDEANDLAVLKIKALGLPVAEFGDSDALAVGDTVYAIGNPLGIELRGTLTDGIVSAINRDIETDGVTMTLIQTNAALNNGNSGGPLINVYGQVVGVNTLKMGSRLRQRGTASVEGLGFAIPISSVAWIVDDLIEYGEVRGEPMLGVTVGAVELPTGERALLVHEVEEGSGCEAAGIRVGDAIVGAEGEAVRTTDDLLRIRRRFRAGETMTIKLDRVGKRFEVSVTLQATTE